MPAKTSKSNRLVATLALALTVAAAGNAAATAGELKVFSGGPMKGAVTELLPAYEAASKSKITMVYEPMGTLLKKLEAGEAADVVILSAEAMARAEKKGWIDAQSIAEVGRVGIGVGVKAGAPVPDISTPDAFRKALLAAKTVTATDPTKGTSGKHFAEVLVKLGIADQMQPKLRLIEGGFAAERVASGEVEMAVQQMTEVIPVKGVTYVGPLPADLQKITLYSGALSKTAKDAAAAKAFLAHLQTAAVRPAFIKRGFMQ